MSTVELSFYPGEKEKSTGAGGIRHFSSKVLFTNVCWFVRVRWFVVLLFLLVGGIHFIDPLWLRQNGFIPPGFWPFVMAGVLSGANIVFTIHLRKLKTGNDYGVRISLWAQIFLDLVIVTVFVHYAGSINTFVSFLYIFHIAMACIFFKPFGSLLVTISSSLFYAAVVTAERCGILRYHSIVVYPFDQRTLPVLTVIFKAGSAVFIWLVTWYLVSSLSRVIRKQEDNILRINEKLTLANRNSAMRVLVTTHELKTPFSDIETLINRLKYSQWSDIPSSARNVINSIAQKSKTMRERIGEILMLGNLRLQMLDAEEGASADIAEVIQRLVEAIKENALERGITVINRVTSCYVFGTNEHLWIMFSNLITNALVYSKKGSSVVISMKEYTDYIAVSVKDEGIGITKKAIPHIFDEYFRAEEGREVNSSSTGLGLSIVREIAKNYNYGIRVISEAGKGTLFEIRISKRKD